MCRTLPPFARDGHRRFSGPKDGREGSLPATISHLPSCCVTNAPPMPVSRFLNYANKRVERYPRRAGRTKLARNPRNRDTRARNIRNNRIVRIYESLIHADIYQSRCIARFTYGISESVARPSFPSSGQTIDPPPRKGSSTAALIHFIRIVLACPPPVASPFIPRARMPAVCGPRVESLTP